MFYVKEKCSNYASLCYIFAKFLHSCRQGEELGNIFFFFFISPLKQATTTHVSYQKHVMFIILFIPPYLELSSEVFLKKEKKKNLSNLPIFFFLMKTLNIQIFLFGRNGSNLFIHSILHKIFMVFC